MLYQEIMPFHLLSIKFNLIPDDLENVHVLVSSTIIKLEIHFPYFEQHSY